MKRIELILFISIFSIFFFHLGFCFKLSNLQGKSIYSTRGLKGEALTSAKMPGNISECIMR